MQGNMRNSLADAAGYWYSLVKVSAIGLAPAGSRSRKVNTFILGVDKELDLSLDARVCWRICASSRARGLDTGRSCRRSYRSRLVPFEDR